jgi:two-component system, LytTR family, sensor kinase
MLQQKMKLMRFSKKEILYSFLITSGFYVLFFTFFPQELKHAHARFIPIALDIVSINLAVLISWRLNIIFSDHFDQHYKWEERPIIRLITQIIITSFIAFGVTLALMIPNALITNHLYPDLMDKLTDHNNLIERITYYFIAIMVLFQSIFIGGNFYKRWIDSSLEAQKLKYENVHAHLHALQNQSQPHFLFNTLNTLTSLIEEDQKTAIEFVQQLSNFYRYLLQREEHHLVHLEEELHFVNSYIFLQKKRFGDNLKIIITVDEECGKKYLPVFVLLILFENAVKHNIVSSEMPLCIKVYCEDDYLVVENNLQKKLSIPPSNGYGLANVRNRYHILSENEIVIEETEKTFKVKIPLLQGKEKYESVNY